MSEEQLIIGEDNEKDAKAFFTKLCKWDLLVENIDLFEKRQGGIDQLYKVYDPLIDKNLIIPVECKYRSDNPQLDTFIYDLKKKLDKIPDSKKLNDSPIASEFNSNIYYLSSIFLNIKEFDLKKYNKKLSSIPIKSSSNFLPSVISIITNDKICRLIGVLKGKEELKFFYPLIGKNKEKGKMFSEKLSYTLLFSNIIAGEYTQDNNKIRFIISFETISESALKYINAFMVANQFYNESKKEEGTNLNLYFIASEKYNYDNKNELETLCAKFSLFERKDIKFLTDNFKIENSLEGEL